MHELALCHSIYSIVDRARDGRPVEVVHVRIGALRQVVPETLVHCWEVVTRTSVLDGSRVEVERVPVALVCRDCGVRSVLDDVLVLTCGACESGRTEVVGGEELVVTALDLADRAQASEVDDG